MDVKSLQIGDYVNYRGQIIKVTSLYDKGGSNEVGWSDKESVWVNADNVQPIPLTPEILEKNGFYYDEDRKAYLMGVIFRVKPERYGLFSFEICGCPYSLNTVHELQHALRLCGIEKEIIL